MNYDSLVKERESGYFDLSDSVPVRYPFTNNDFSPKGDNSRYIVPNVSSNLLAYLFFSKDNIGNIQKILKLNVYKINQQVISDQSIEDLQVIMKSIYTTHGSHPPSIELVPKEERQKVLKMYTEEVSRLNQIMIDTLLPIVVPEIKSYIEYLNDIQNPYRLLKRPESLTVTGTRSYRSATNILTGV